MTIKLMEHERVKFEYIHSIFPVYLESPNIGRACVSFIKSISVTLRNEIQTMWNTEHAKVKLFDFFFCEMGFQLYNELDFLNLLCKCFKMGNRYSGFHWIVMKFNAFSLNKKPQGNKLSKLILVLTKNRVEIGYTLFLIYK